MQQPAPACLQANIDYVGETKGDEFALVQPCSYAVGVFDRASGRLQLAQLGGGRVLRMEPRVHGLQYDAPESNAAEGDDGSRAVRLAANKQ